LLLGEESLPLFLGKELLLHQRMPPAKRPQLDEAETGPLRLICPSCKAKAGKECLTSPGRFSAVHIARI
jgi:hypothetical protein